MAEEMSPGKPTTRRYSEAEKQRAVRAVLQLRKELGTEHGTVKRVSTQLGIGVESLRSGVKQAGIDDRVRSGTSTEDAARIKPLDLHLFPRHVGDPFEGGPIDPRRARFTCTDAELRTLGRAIAAVTRRWRRTPRPAMEGTAPTRRQHLGVVVLR